MDRIKASHGFISKLWNAGKSVLMACEGLSEADTVMTYMTHVWTLHTISVCGRHSTRTGPEPVLGPHQGLPRLHQQAVECGQVRAHGLPGPVRSRHRDDIHDPRLDFAHYFSVWQAQHQDRT